MNGRRVRLTRVARRERQAADDKAPFPGSINKENMAEDQRGSTTYRTFEPSVENHELADMRTEWKNDRHNEVGMGVPDAASGTLISASHQAKCYKATQLSELLLGPRASNRMIIAQARDFLSLDSHSIERTLERFAHTEALYASEDVETPATSEEDEVSVAPDVAVSGVPMPAPDAPEGSAAAPTVYLPDAGTIPAEAAVSAPSVQPVAPLAAPASAVPAVPAALTPIEGDLELSDEASVTEEGEPDENLSAVFSNPTVDGYTGYTPKDVAVEPQARTASTKVGVKSIGGRAIRAGDAAVAPKTADDLTGIWKDVPTDMTGWF